MVCDSCNNYFSLKIEKPTLEHYFFKNLRFRNHIESKKGRLPKGNCIIPFLDDRPEIWFPEDTNSIKINVNKKSFQKIFEEGIKHIYIPFSFPFPEKSQYVSRFLAKIGYEFLVLNLIQNNVEDQESIIDDPALDPIRAYVRYNSKNENWDYFVRKIYDETETFLREGNVVDMIFECDFLLTPQEEIYFIIVFKGVEFALNLAGDSIEGYQQWLDQNEGTSPLYLM